MKKKYETTPSSLRPTKKGREKRNSVEKRESVLLKVVVVVAFREEKKRDTFDSILDHKPSLEKRDKNDEVLLTSCCPGLMG